MLSKLLYLLLTIVFTKALIANPYAIQQSATSTLGMVATQDSYATKVGIDILKKGGNAIDAAVAIGYAMAVTHPQAGNLAGGGFMLIYNAATQQTYALDYREKAPKKAHKNMFLNENGKVDNQKSRFSALSVGVPGTVAGLEVAYAKFGSLKRSQLINPAIKLAKKGFIIKQGLANALEYRTTYLSQYPYTKSIFFNDNNIKEKGMLLKQPDLAKTLTIIKKKGADGFYSGPIAIKIINYIEHEGGIMSLDDLKSYKPVWRKPVTGTYKGYQIASMPPPSSGGIAIIESLNILESLKLKSPGYQSADYIHLVVETLKHVYADRAHYLGDTDFVNVPIDTLISKQYANKIAEQISTKNILLSKYIKPNLQQSQPESTDTTHFVVADQYGNVVSNTYTLNFSFGNAMMVPGVGVLLNNEMDDFSAKPGVPNAYGLLGNKQNSIEPEKRMLSSMSPTIVLKDNKPYIVTGSPGGSRIITTTLQVILNVIEHNMTIAEAVSAPRFHHQWQPDYIRIESGFSSDTLSILSKKGYIYKLQKNMGSAQSIVIKDNTFFGFADTRKQDSLALGL